LYGTFKYRNLRNRNVFISLLLLWVLLGCFTVAYLQPLGYVIQKVNLHLAAWIFLGGIVVQWYIREYAPVPDIFRKNLSWDMPSGASNLWSTFVVTLLILGTVYFLSVKSHAALPFTMQHEHLQAPLALKGWRGPYASTDFLKIEPIPVPDKVLRVAAKYRFQLEEVLLHMVYYKRPHRVDWAGLENTLYDKNHWEVIDTSALPITLQNGDKMVVRETTLKAKHDHEKKIIWHWYFVGQYTSSKKNWLKILYQATVFTGENSGTGIMGVACNYEEDVNQARGLLKNYLEAMYPQILTLMTPAQGYKKIFTKNYFNLIKK